MSSARICVVVVSCLSLLLVLPLAGAPADSSCVAGQGVLERTALTTLTAVELERGETLRFALRNGQQRTLQLVDTWARVLLTNLEDTRQGHHGGGTVYTFGCAVVIDGQPMTMVRYVPVQASFYEPYVVDGMRIWFDGVREIGGYFNETHGDCVPRKDARFALQDATLPICEEEIRPWYPSGESRLDVHACYNGDDTWLGPYFGSDLHGGLDVNMPIGTPLWAPIGIDEQFYFNALAAGHNNNRWRAIRRWGNGQRWVLQTHHIARLLVPEHRALQRGEHFAAAAGELTGSHAHSHFVFKVGEDPDEILLDPWILFWQIFENNQRRAGGIHAEISPLAPATTGTPIAFDAQRTRPGVSGGPLSYRWTFGDGACAVEPAPVHTFVKPGMYPVTLVISDGVQLASTTQHIAIDGDPVARPSLVLCAPDEIEFSSRPVHAMDTYGVPPSFLPHTLRFVARPSSNARPPAQRIVVQNAGGGTLRDVTSSIHFPQIPGWARIERTGSGNTQELLVRVDAARLKPKHGIYQAVVRVDCPQAVNSPQYFAIQLTTPPDRPATDVIVDSESDDCYRSLYFWHAPRFHSAWTRGFGGTFLVPGDTEIADGFVRFQPDLAAGTYELSLPDETPVRPTARVAGPIRYRAQIRHKDGTDVVWVEPLTSRVIGTFTFDEGRHGFVHIDTGGAAGLVVADAIRFHRTAATSTRK